MWVCVRGGCSRAGEWAAHHFLPVQSGTLPPAFATGAIHSRLRIKKNSQKQEAGQAGAAWPRTAQSVPERRKAARSSCAVIWSQARANLHFQQWNETPEPLFSKKKRRKKEVLYHPFWLSHMRSPGSQGWWFPKWGAHPLEGTQSTYGGPRME